LADKQQHALTARRINDRDIEVDVPETARDPTDTVIVLVMKDTVQGGKGRLLASNVAENQLLAFDAGPHGKFTYGDGKAGRYYASGFANVGDYLAWPIRLNEPATFDVWVRYSGGNGTKLVLQAGDQSVSATTAESDAKAVQAIQLGRLALSPREYELRFAPQPPSELNLFDVVLKPAQ
jgi:hypothetical protein